MTLMLPCLVGGGEVCWNVDVKWLFLAAWMTCRSGEAGDGNMADVTRLGVGVGVNAGRPTTAGEGWIGGRVVGWICAA